MARIIRSPRTLALVSLAALACLAAAPPAARAEQGSFERTLKVTGRVDLSVRAGSGRIRLTPGAAGTVRISARLRADNSWFSGDVSDRIRRIEQNPPVRQEGNTIRVGEFDDEGLQRNISISYDITVPADTRATMRTGSGGIEIGDLSGPIEAHSGSGGITIGRIGGAVAASTGSGSITVRGAGSLDAHSGSGAIEAFGVAGPATTRSGSGSVRIEQTGKGDLDVSSSSGEVEITGANGAARVSSSSGGIEIEGRPSGAWTLHASSGGISIRFPSDAAFDLDARVGSGGIESAHPITMTGRVDRHRMQGKVRGGGPLVSVESSSGGIRIR